MILIKFQQLDGSVYPCPGIPSVCGKRSVVYLDQDLIVPFMNAVCNSRVNLE